uniref:Uncharacterized protein n=1 Tax=Salinispora arenicola (strain CNS-205) TaxID=391037 RepID=A8LYY8_SALAI
MAQHCLVEVVLAVWWDGEDGEVVEFGGAAGVEDVVEGEESLCVAVSGGGETLGVVRRWWQWALPVQADGDGGEVVGGVDLAEEQGVFDPYFGYGG